MKRDHRNISPAVYVICFLIFSDKVLLFLNKTSIKCQIRTGMDYNRMETLKLEVLEWGLYMTFSFLPFDFDNFS